MSSDLVPSANSALVSFTAENVRSFRDEVHLSLLATRLAMKEAIRDLSTVGTRTPLSLLPSAGIFGPNASGKSTILRAIADMRNIVLASFRRGDATTGIPRLPFLLGDTADRASRFEVELILGGVRWQYGFETDDHRILSEHAYHYPRGRQALVFRRETNAGAISFGPSFRPAGRAIAQFVPDNALVLSVAGATKDNPLAPLFAWFRANLKLMESGNRDPRIALTADLIQSSKEREGILSLMQAADLGISDIERFQPELDPNEAEQIQRVLQILNEQEDETESTKHEFIYGDMIRLHHAGRNGPVAIDPVHESQGTLVWLGLVGPVLQALRAGTTVLIDELDASLHPHLAKELIAVFQDHDMNLRCAQLIFNAHDTTVLGDSGRRLLGRDQIWFTEKDTDGATTLYPLSDFHPKGDEAIGRRYLQGRYGAVPVLDRAGFRKAADSTSS